MQEFFQLLISAGESGTKLSFHILLPVMVIMMALMRVLDNKGVLRRIAIWLTPVFGLFGLPGLGVFAILQIHFVSFAAPVSTFKIMDQDEIINDRRIAASFAGILTMSQANAAFPLAAVGLNLWVTMLTSLLGGLLAGWVTYKFFTRKFNKEESNIINEVDDLKSEIQPAKKEGIIKSVLAGAEEGLQLVLKSIPLLVIAIFLVNVLKSLKVIEFLGKTLAPVLTQVGLPGAAILPIVTKYIAGGTAMMGVSMKLVTEGSMTALQLNKIAGLLTNPLDPVGVAILAAAGPRIAKVTIPAIKGALIGILFRGIAHFIIF